MSPAAVVVGMCIGIAGLVTVLCAWMAHDADSAAGGGGGGSGGCGGQAAGG